MNYRRGAPRYTLNVFGVSLPLMLFLFWTLFEVDVTAGSSRSQMIAWGQAVSPAFPRPPGNSMEALDYAYELGYDGIELDLQLTKDQIPVIIHDTTIDATTDGTGYVADYTFEELQQFSLGIWRGKSVRIPSLEAALRLNGSRGRFFADMRISASHITAIREAVDNAGFNEEYLSITAYSIDEGLKFKAAFPNAQVVLKQYSMPHQMSPPVIDAVADTGLDGLMLMMPEDSVSVQDFVDYVHWKGLTLTLFVHYYWRTFEELQQMVDDGVDYILMMRDELLRQIQWPVLDPEAPGLGIEFDNGRNAVLLSWRPQRPFAYRLQTSHNLNHWEPLKASYDMSGAPDIIRYSPSLQRTNSNVFYRLKRVR